MLRRLYILAMLMTGFLSVSASVYNTTVIDKETEATMAAVYGAQYAIESSWQADAKKIMESYEASAAATSTIWITKWSDRKAMTNLDLWSSDENYYYRRIYYLVFNCILPKTIMVTAECMKEPESALYWGSYIMQVCAETKRLCQQFETVVTNGRLSFKDLPFLQLQEAFQKIVDLTKLGNTDWRETFNNFKNQWAGMFSEEQLNEDYDMLYEMGVQLAQAGVMEITGKLVPQLKTGASFTGKFNQNIGMIKNIIEGRVFDMVDTSVMTALNTTIGRDVFASGDVTRLLTTGTYDIQGWISNYVNNAPKQYYTQKVEIIGKGQGTEEVIIDYTPDHTQLWNWGGNRESPWALEDWSVWESNFGGKGLGGFPDRFNDGRLLDDVAKKASENITGWSQERVASLNANQDEYVYSIIYSVLDYRYGPGSHDNLNPNKPNEHHGDYDRAVGYKIKVIRTHNIKAVVFEEVFDSYKMSRTMFNDKVNLLCEQYNKQSQDPDSEFYGVHFEVVYGAQNFYSLDDAKRLNGAKKCSIIVECHDEIDLAEGDIQYKCNDDCEDPGDWHMTECSLQGTSREYVDNFAEKIEEYEQAQASLTAQQSAIESKRNKLLTQMSQPGISSDELARLRKEFADLGVESQKLDAQIDGKADTLRMLRKYQAEEQASYSSSIPTIERIPTVEQRLETYYGVRWQNDGKAPRERFRREGNDYIYIREAKPTGHDMKLTFEARVTMYDPAHFFLGIRYHRAKIKIHWSLKGHGESTTEAKVIDLDPEADPEENAKIVNEEAAKIRAEFPDCSVTTKYEYVNPEQTDDTEDVQHLLWASERMEIARETVARLTAIYSSLITLDHFLHYKHSIVDWLKDMVPFINDQYGKRQTYADFARRRWMNSSYMAIGRDDLVQTPTPIKGKE